MIIFLTTYEHRYTIKGIIESPALTADVKVKAYSWLFSRRQLARATYIFTDIERLAHHELSAAAKIYGQMRSAGLTVYNNPALVRGRAALLHHLNVRGLNDFAAYPAVASPQPARFPVFIKNDNNHTHQFEGLIDDQAALDAELERVEASGIPLKHLLVIEFCAKPLREGIFQKHSEFRVGDQYVPYDSILEANWCAKRGDHTLMTPDERRETVRIMRENPFAKNVMPAFETARIEYGRIDFGFVDGKMAVYEINTNPNVNSHTQDPPDEFLQAFNDTIAGVVRAVCRLDTDSGPPVKLFSRRHHKKSVTKTLGVSCSPRRL